MIRLKRRVKLSWNEALLLSATLNEVRGRLRLVNGYEGWRFNEDYLQGLENLLDKKLWGKVR